MGRVVFTEKLKKEYEKLYQTCIIKSSKFDSIDKLCDKLISHKQRYENVAKKIGCPWYFIAVIHNMESGQRFTRHLHNGDRLTARTIHVPKGRPKRGKPPFTWEESAIDALKLQRINKVKDWSLGRLLYEIEKYNGWGYRLYHPYVLSPYLWSWSNKYSKGKYVADGRWSNSAVSHQCGAAVLLRRLEERGDISISVPKKPPETHTSKNNANDNHKIPITIFRYSTKRIKYAKKLQKFLNSFRGIVLRVDGIPGKKTSSAVKKLFGFYLNGDPRNNA